LAALERDGEAATRDSSADGPVAAAPLPPPETEGMMPAQLSLPEVGAPTNSELSPEPAPAAAPNTRDSPSATTAAPGETNKAAR
jgi:hypothetical protein